MPRPKLLVAVLVMLVLLPAPAAFGQDPDPADGPVFVARDVEPTITNAEELGHVLRRVYPSGYRDTGLDVTAILWVYVARDGTVGATKVLKSTGYDVFDRAATQVGEAIVFEPALRDGEPVAVWMNQAIHFESGDSGGFLEGPALVADDVVRERNAARNDQEQDKP